MTESVMNLKSFTPQLSIQERNRRWQAVRKDMEDKGIDCLVVWGNTISQGLAMTNIRYLTQVGSCTAALRFFR